jgi:hypothetical protein
MEHSVSASYPGPTFDHQYTAGGDQALVDGLFDEPGRPDRAGCPSTS